MHIQNNGMEWLLFAVPLSTGAVIGLISSRIGMRRKAKAVEALKSANIPSHVLKQALKLNPALTGTAMSRAVSGFKEYLSLYILEPNVKFGMPSRGIDDVWHAFLEFPNEYESFCLKYVGRVIEHTPFEHKQSSSKAHHISLNAKVHPQIYNTSVYTRKHRDQFTFINDIPLIFAFDAIFRMNEGWVYSKESFDSMQKATSASSSASNSGGCSGSGSCGGFASILGVSDGPSGGDGGSSSHGDSDGGGCGGGCGD